MTKGVRDSNPQVLFPAAARMLNGIGSAHLELREPPIDGTFGASEGPAIAPAVRRAFNGVLVLNSDYDRARGQAALDAGHADAISFGRPFIGSPDFPRRLSEGRPLVHTSMEHWFSQTETGYVDYVRAA